MYSGQGSQYFNMGKELYEKNIRFRSWMDYCDELAYFYLNTSLLDKIFDKNKGLGDPFDRLLYTNPAILCIEFSLTKVLIECNIRPSIMVGYSLGEITALVISGAIGLEDGIRFTIESAKLLEKEGVFGGMLSVLDSDKGLEKHRQLFDNCWLSGKNFDGNSVFSGTRVDVDELQKNLKKVNVAFHRLPINYAFHSPLMSQHKDDILAMAKSLSINDISIPILSSVDSKPIYTLGEKHIWNILFKPVQFAKTIKTLIKQEDSIFIDVGPSGTLATFIKYLSDENDQPITSDTINQYGKNCQSLNKTIQYLQKDSVGEIVKP
jgi:bacillaene synthase trans-acting acyltransferase